jgi:hypothetical protein
MSVRIYAAYKHSPINSRNLGELTWRYDPRGSVAGTLASVCEGAAP